MSKVVDINKFRLKKINSVISEKQAIKEMFQYILDFALVLENSDMKALEDLCLIHGASFTVRLNSGVFNSFYEVELDLNPQEHAQPVDTKEFFSVTDRSLDICMFRLATDMKDYYNYLIKWF